MEPKTLDFTKGMCEGSCVYQGATFSHELTWEQNNNPLTTPAVYTPVDLTGYTAKMQVRVKPNDPLIFELSTTNSRIILGGVNGTIKLLISATDTATIPAGKYRYDLKLTSPTNHVTYLIQGIFEVVEEITST